MGSDLAKLLLRVALGATMVAHGVRHANTLEGTAGWFRSIGFREPELQAKASAVVEIGAGGALIAGAATPLAASAVIGTMTVAARSVHAQNGFFITSEGYEYVLNLGVAALALSALGPGRISVDGLGRRGAREMTGVRRAALTAALGLAAGALQLAMLWRRPVRAADPLS
jgi:putative oxidoreductase